LGYDLDDTARRLRARLTGTLATRLPTARSQWHRPLNLHGPALDAQPRPLRNGRRALINRRAVTIQAWLPGHNRAVATVRRDLHHDVSGAARAVAVGMQAGRPVQPLAAITARLQHSAADLDVDLAVIAADPDPARCRRMLVQQDDRVHALQRACEQVRTGVLLAGSATNGALLPALIDDLNDEVLRLGLWASARHELQTSSSASCSSPSSSS